MQTFLHYRWRVPSTLHRLHLRRIIPLLLLALCVTGAKAQSDVKFNDGVRYSQWVIDSRMNNFYANTTECGFAVYNQKGTQTSGRKDGKTSLDYVVGLVAKSIIEASQYYSQYDWAKSFAKPWFLSIKDYGDNFYNKFRSTSGSLDDLNAVKLFIPLRALTETKGKYPDATTHANTATALNTALSGLGTHNSSYSIKSGTTAEKAGKTVAGGWWHKKDYEDQMWLDGSYMGPALLAELVNYSGTTNNIHTTDDWDLIVKQFTILRSMCWNETDKLLYHAFAADGGTNSTSHSDTWAGLSSKDPYVFHSETYWGRAVGWYFLALVDVLEQMEKANISSSDTKFTTLKGYLTETAEGLKARQDASGGWYQILDKDSKFSASYYNNGKSHTTTNNYIESSATALFTAAYLKAIRLGYLAENDYKTVAVNGYKCLVDQFFSVDEKGKVNIFGSCRSAGLGGKGADYASGKERFRDGSNAYYLLGYDVAKVEKNENKTEGKVLGAFIMAATEYERAPENQKDIRFSYDLAPSYTLAQGGSIPVEALGSGAGTATYQWYKTTDGTTGTAVTGATSATFSPKESGKYYCEATSGSTTIKTSTTVVTVEGAGNENVESTDVLQVTTNGQTFDLTQTNIENNSYASVSTTTNWVDKTIDKTSYKLYNMSNSDRKITLKVSGASSFEVKVQNSTNGRTYGISVTDANGNTISSSTITHAGTGVESSGIINTNSTGEITIELTGGGSSVYPYQIIFYTGTSGYTITYITSVGTAPESKSDITTFTADELPTLSADGYTFGGWYTDSNCTTAAIAGATISGNTTLYAKWTINKYTVTATAVNGSIAIKDGNENPVQTNTEVAYGTKLTFTATPNDGYEFTSWSVTGTTGTADGATYTISSLTEATAVTANFTAASTGGGETGNVVTKTGTFPRSEMNYFDGQPDSKFNEVSTIYKNAEGETVSKENAVLTLSSTSENVQAQKNDQGAKVRLGGSFTITAASGYTIKSIELVTDQSSRNLTSSPEVTPEKSGTNFTYNFTEGQQSVTFTNNSSGNIYVAVINVTYEFTATAGKTPLTISFSDSQIEGYKGETITLPTPTVTANGTTASSGVYNVTYKSNNKSIAEDPANNQVTLKTAGTVAITAIVEPKAEYAGQYEGGSAVITVVSKAYTPLTVSVADVMMNSNDGAPTNPDVKVYLNDQLVTSSNYTVSYQVTNGTNVTANGSTLTVTGSAGNYTAGTSTIKVTVTPTDGFASTNHCKAGTATFAYVVNQAGTKLQPEIDFPNEITLGIGVTKTLTSYVKYNGVDVTDLFTKNYVITNSVSSSGASFTNATTGEFYTGTAAATVTIKITATPLPDYADQYEPADKTVTVNIQQLTELTITQPDNMTAKVGEVLDMPSFEIKVKDTGAAVSSDNFDFVINSSSTSVVTVSNDKSKLYAVGAGTATIIVLAKDKTGNTYMDATTSFTVTVTDPTLHIVKIGATASNGQCITDVPNVYMTYGGWVFNPITTYLNKQYGSKKWNAAATDAAGAPVGFPYAVMGNGHEDSRDELGASAAPEGTTIDYESKGFELTDKMFSVPAEGAYFVFTPKVNGTVVAHVLQNGVFDPGYYNGKHAPSYKPNRRVFVVDEGGNRMPDNDIIAHLDVTTGVPKASESDNGTINGISYNFSKNDRILNVGLYKTDYKDANEKTIYLSTDYDFNGSTTNTIDGGIEGFTPTFDEKGNINNFQNKIYKRKVNKDKDNVEGGYVVLSKAPVTYTFKVKAGKSYYLYCFGSKLSLYGYEFKADETVTEDVVNLSETTAPTLSATVEDHVAKVSLDRTFKAGIWNACVLPFSLNQYQVDAIFGKTYDKDNANGTQILYFDRVEGSKIYFVRHAYNHIVAGKPFLIKPTKENAKINTAEIGEFPYVTIEATDTPADFGKSTDYKWASSYAPFTVKPGDYFLRDTQVNGKPADGNMVRYPVTQSGNLSVNGFRGYLKAQTDGVRKSTKSMSIVIGSVDDDETTLIEDVVIDEDGTLRPALKGKVYNIQGQLMTTDASKLNTLPKGIYIVNGSKITVE